MDVDVPTLSRYGGGLPISFATHPKPFAPARTTGTLRYGNYRKRNIHVDLA